MPKGAKKRKAAKKKKEEEANNANNATHSHGDDALKHHDEKESDGGEGSSPASQDHHNHQHPFTEGEEEEEEKSKGSSCVRSFADENKSLEGVNNNGEGAQKTAIEGGVVQIDRELKPEDESESKNIRIEYCEPPRKSHDGDSSGSSSSSSSDDESHVVEKNTVVVENAPAVDSIKLADSLSEVVIQVTDSIPVGEAYNLVVETAPVLDSDNVSLLEEVVHVNESASVDNSMTSDVVELGLKENGEEKLPSLDENSGVSPVVNLMDLGSQKMDDELVSTLEETAAASLDAKDFAAQENEDKLMLSFNATRVDTNKGAEHIKDSEIPECSDSQPLVASVPRPVQTTSWKSCCGLFEALTGSNR